MEVDNKLALTIIKWVIIVFIAGFIGQFGKSLTKQFLRWLRERKAKKKPVQALKEKPSKKLSKLEKKRQKVELKRLKKGK